VLRSNTIVLHEYLEIEQSCRIRGCFAAERTIASMQKKIFWMVFMLLGLVADIMLPFWWACAATLPILYASWWIAYRSDWF
jgi:hypothetical protein